MGALSQLNLKKSKFVIETWKFRVRETFRNHRVESPYLAQGSIHRRSHDGIRWEHARKRKRFIPTHHVEQGLGFSDLIKGAFIHLFIYCNLRFEGCDPCCSAEKTGTENEVTCFETHS